MLGPGQAHIELAPVGVTLKRDVIQQEINAVKLPSLGLVDGRDKNRLPVMTVKILVPGVPDKFLQVAAVLSIAADLLKIGNQIQAVFQAAAVLINGLKPILGAVPNRIADNRSGILPAVDGFEEKA